MEYVDNLPPMDLMRSEKMVFFQLILPFESAQLAISYLGELGLLQFCDIESCPLQKQASQTLDDNNDGFQRLMEGFFGPRRHPNFVFGLIDKYVQKLELFVHCWK